VPYLVNRVKRVIGVNEIKRFCLWDQTPSAREYIDKFGKTVMTYDFVGRVHLDYIELYRKHNTQQRLSYALNAIGEIEVGETKTPYEGTLDDLYKKDLLKFIEYNRQDVMLMVKIDNKNKFIELANQIAHANCVLLKTTMGSVALVDQAIINEMHEMGRVVPNRRSRDDDPKAAAAVAFVDDDDDDEERTPVVGAYVAQPKKGLHRHVGAVDINSLYPSTIRALNMSPETLVGQVRLDETMKLIEERAVKLPNRAEAWEGIFETLEVQHMHNRDDAVLTVDFIDNLTETITTKAMTGAELYDFVFDENNHVCITANGTLFRTDIEGMIPLLLAKWYSERKSLQKQMREWQSKYDEAETDTEHEEAKWKIAFFNQRQLAKKILLNSLYGALLQQHCLFYDARIGQSVTLTGRSIVRHMNATINQIITGEHDYKGEAIYYSDTDSVAGDSLIRTNCGSQKIEDLFQLYSDSMKSNGQKEYVFDQELRVMGYHKHLETTAMMPINYIYRHRVRKARYRITDSSGRRVVVTGDHSVMVRRNHALYEIKPAEIQNGDVLVVL
jgi:DNA polymerase elongation subunit (family B)